MLTFHLVSRSVADMVGCDGEGRRCRLRAQPRVLGPHALAALRYSTGAVAPTQRGDTQHQQHDTLHRRGSENGDERNMMLLLRSDGWSLRETIRKGRNMWVTVRRRQVHRSTPARFIDQLWTDIFFKLLYSLCNNITNVILFVEQFSKNSTF